MFNKLKSLLHKTTDNLTKKVMIANAMDWVTTDLSLNTIMSFDSGNIEWGLNTVAQILNKCFNEPYHSTIKKLDMDSWRMEREKINNYSLKIWITNRIISEIALNIDEVQSRGIKLDNILEKINPKISNDKIKFLSLNCGMLEYLIEQQWINKSSKQIKNRLFLIFSTSGKLLSQVLEKWPNDDSLTDFWQSKYKDLYEKLIKSLVGSIPSVDIRHIELLIKK